MLIFVGFETAANLAEETAVPERSIPRAVLGAVVIVSLFYLIAAYVEVAGFGFDLAVITSPEVAGAPLFALGAPGSPAESEFWLKILLLVVFLDMLAVYVGAVRRVHAGCLCDGTDRRLPSDVGVRVEALRNARGRDLPPDGRTGDLDRGSGGERHVAGNCPVYPTTSPSSRGARRSAVRARRRVSALVGRWPLRSYG